MSNRFFISLLVGIAIAFGVFVVVNRDDSSQTANNEVAPTENIYSQGSSGVTFTEYGDFQCPACLQFEPIMQELREKYKDVITFRFRHFPLTQIHTNALIAARAAEAAAMQDKFWEMHDMIYNNQDPSGQTGWVASGDPTSFFEGFAEAIGLDTAKFLEDLRSPQTNELVQADLQEALRLGFSGTPSFTLNGEQIDRPESKEALFQLIDEAIADSSN